MPATPYTIQQRRWWLVVPSQKVLPQCALVFAMFCLTVCGGMLVSHIRDATNDPLKSTELLALKDKLVTSPQDEQLKQQIRTLDLELRGRYFRQLWLNRTGAWLALGALGLFVLGARQALSTSEPLPNPQPRREPQNRTARTAAQARWSVVAVSAVIAAGWVAASMPRGSVLPADARSVDGLLALTPGPAVHTGDFAPAVQMQQNWPRFRGPGGNGVALDTNAPLSWDVKSGRGVVWTSALPVAGFNSPIVWGERIFVSGGDATKRAVVCFDAQKGELLWERSVQISSVAAGKVAEVPDQTGYAASTMATDGRRVYVIFANGDLAAFALDGKEVWAKNLGVPKNPNGHASSLLTWEGRLIAQVDQGEAQQNVSKLYALDGPTGRVLWQHNRPVPSSWASPIVIKASGKPQIVTLGTPWVIGYAAADGAELWRVDGLSGEVTPSPVFAGGLILAVSPNDKLMAIRPDGQGDVTKTHVAWSVEDNIPDISSPVSNGELVFTLSTPGVLTCYDIKDGKKIWEHDLAMECNASPTIVGSRIYLVGVKGGVVVAEAARAFRELARSELGENLYASPAFVRGHIYFRGATHLFCIGLEAHLAKAE
jgi:outer membrane protein assembly factor BamB